jgi:2-polyprenyl-6-methoxyphenol hydroxylase-like FAD-dependent oxidoreductase
MISTAVVVGGGIAGLSAARALHRAGWQATVLESASEFGEVGAGLTLMTNGLRGLDALGLSAPIRAAGRTAGSGGTRRRSGQWLSYLDGADMVRVLGTSSLGIRRATLHRILRDSLPAGAEFGMVPLGDHGTACHGQERRLATTNPTDP